MCQWWCRCSGHGQPLSRVARLGPGLLGSPSFRTSDRGLVCSLAWIYTEPESANAAGPYRQTGPSTVVGWPPSSIGPIGNVTGSVLAQFRSVEIQARSIWTIPPPPLSLDQDRWEVATYTDSSARQLSGIGARHANVSCASQSSPRQAPGHAQGSIR
jgi:hypothetical protein